MDSCRGRCDRASSIRSLARESKTPILRHRRVCSASSGRVSYVSLSDKEQSHRCCLVGSVDKHNRILFNWSIDRSKSFDVHLVGEDVFSIIVEGVVASDIQVCSAMWGFDGGRKQRKCYQKKTMFCHFDGG